MTAEESTDGEVEAQTYNQDSQDSIGEVRVFEKTNILISAEIAIFFFYFKLSRFLEMKSQIRSCRFSVETTYNHIKFRLAVFNCRHSILVALYTYLYK